MRDDTASLVNSILIHFDRRIILLEELLRREMDLEHSIQQGPAETQAILDMCEDIFSRISVIDCDIAGDRDRLCHIAGISQSDLEKKIGEDNPDASRQWRDKQELMSELAFRICSMRENSIMLMERINKKTEKDIHELSVLRRLLGRFSL